jgi:Tol biopolymer transport system component
MMKRLATLLLLALAAGGLPGGSGCDGNLGDVSTGPISFRVSAATNFAPADGPSSWPATSFDGSLVAFESRAMNLTRTEPGYKELLLRDRNTQRTISLSRLVSVADKTGLADCERPAMSADGSWVIFSSRRDRIDATDPPAAETFKSIFRYNHAEPVGFLSDIIRTLPVAFPSTPVDGDCLEPAVSADGAVIVFTSFATNIDTTPANASTGTEAQIYVIDINADVHRLISHAFGAPGTPCNAHAYNPVVSADGQWIVFLSAATNLIAGGTTGSKVKVYRSSLDGSVVELVSRLDGTGGAEADNHCASPSINANGSLVGFAYEGGNLAVAPNKGILGFPLLVRDFSVPASPVNRVVAQDVFLFGLFGSGPKAMDRSVMTASGDAIVYMAPNAELTDLAVRVVSTVDGSSRIASKGIIDQGATSQLEEFWQPTISGDGRWVFWRSDYPQEVPGDTNALSDIFGYGPLR